MNLGDWVLRETIKGDTLLGALMDQEDIVFHFLVGLTCTLVHVFLLVWKRPRYQASNLRHRLIVCRKIVEDHRSLMRPWCNEGEGPSAVNVNLYGGSQSQVQ